MNQTARRFLWTTVYAVAMALLEAVVVVYIRGLLEVTEDHVALGPCLRLEMWREVGTIVMLAAVGWLAGRRRIERWAYGLFAFGLWDICYYAWLWLLIDWPATLLDWDVLFLIPLRWWGPVLSPMLIAALICVVAVLAVVRLERGERLGVKLARVTAVALGGLLALYVFMATSLGALLAGQTDWDTLRPEPFKWPLFLVALALMAVPSLMAVWPGRRTKPQIAVPRAPLMRGR